MKRSYAVVFERAPANYAAYCPDVPGCVSVGDDWDEIQAMIREALTVHIEFMLERGEPAPEPTRSIEDAMRYHCDLAVDGVEAPFEVTVALVEVDILSAAAVAADAAASGL